MCRAGNEGPGVHARRCMGGLTHEQFLAKRRADYAANKGGVRDKRLQRGKKVQQSPINKRFITQEEAEGQVPIQTSTQEQRVVAEYITEANSTPLATNPIVDEDTDFYDNNSTLNIVRRLTTSDGQVGYWKALEENSDPMSQTDYDMYGQTLLGGINNEVAAYQLSQVMGEGWAGLVPETVIREYNDSIGSFQAEAPGVTYVEYELQMLGEDKGLFDEVPAADAFSVDVARKVAVFDFLIGNQDRNKNNFLAEQTSTGGTKVTLIDNGFSFPDSNDIFVNKSFFTESLAGDKSVDKKQKKLTKTELSELQRLYDDPTSGGMDKYLTPYSFAAFRARLQYLLSYKKVPSFRTYAGSEITD